MGVEGSTSYKQTFSNEELRRIIERRNTVGDVAQSTTIQEPVKFVSTPAATIQEHVKFVSTPAATWSESRAKVVTAPQVVNQPKVEAVLDDRMKMQIHSIVEEHLASERASSKKAMDAFISSQAHQLDLLVSNKTNHIHGLIENVSASCEQRFKQFEAENRRHQQDLQQLASQFGQINLNSVQQTDALSDRGGERTDLAMEEEINHLQTTVQNLQQEIIAFERKQMSSAEKQASSHEELLALYQTSESSHAYLLGRIQSEAKRWSAGKQDLENMCDEKFNHVVIILERLASEAEADRKAFKQKRTSLKSFVETKLKALNETVHEHKRLWEARLSVLEPRVDE